MVKLRWLSDVRKDLGWLGAGTETCHGPESYAPHLTDLSGPTGHLEAQRTLTGQWYALAWMEYSSA